MTSSPSTSPRNSLDLALISHYPTPQAALAAHNPDMQTLFGTDNLAAYRSYTPALATLSRVYGRETAEAWLEIQLKNLADYSGARDKLNEFQRLQLARVIIGEWGFLRLSELMRFFFRFKAGRYGRFYGSVDPLVITEAICLYQQERLGEIAEIEKEERRAQDEADRAVRDRHHAELHRAAALSGLDRATFIRLWTFNAPDIPPDEFAPIAWLFDL